MLSSACYMISPKPTTIRRYFPSSSLMLRVPSTMSPKPAFWIQCNTSTCTLQSSDRLIASSPIDKLAWHWMERGKTSSLLIQVSPKDHQFHQSFFLSTFDSFSPPSSKSIPRRPHPAISTMLPALLLEIVRRKIAKNWKQLPGLPLNGETTMQ